MRRFAIVLFCLISVAAIAERPTFPVQNGVPVEANFGCLSIGTPTISLSDTIASAAALSDYLPATTQGFYCHVAGDVVLAHSDNIATSGASTGRIGYLLASGTYFKWDGLAGTFTGKVVADSGNATLTIDICW